MNYRVFEKTALAIAVWAALPVQAQNVTLEEVVVTARRVQENIQDVPISMTVFSQNQLNDRNITVASDLANYTPSLSVNERYGPEKSSFSIRGFNQDQATAPTVGVYFADVVGVRAQGGTTSGNTVGAGAFMDLQNVQVLKGPQGTLFGRNTDGGAILLVPQEPVDEFGGYIEGSVGNYDMTRVQGALNVPLTDSFRVRFAADINQRDGYMENKSGNGPDFNDRDYEAYRLSAIWEITDSLENYTILHSSDSNTAGYASRYVACDREAAVPDEIGQISINAMVTLAACEQIDRQAARGDDEFDVEVNAPRANLSIKQWQFINTTTWEVNDSLTVKNILSYGEFEEKSRFSLYSDNFTVPDSVNFLNFGFPAPITPGTPFRLIELGMLPGESNAAQNTWTEELQLQGFAFDDRLQYVVGGYLEYSDPDGLNGGRTGIFTYCDNVDTTDCDFSAIPLAGNISQSATKLKFENHGIFAQGTFDITDEFALTAGVRYTFDKIEGYDQGVRIAPAPFTTEPLIATCRDSFRFPGVIADDPKVCGKTLEEESDEPTWLVNLDYKPSPDALIYAKYARGYRQGGINFTNPGVETWGPEEVDNYEVGAKLTYRGAIEGILNIAAFYNDYTDQQVFGSLITDRVNYPQVSGGAAIVNAGKSEISGIEVDAVAVLTDNLKVTLAYAYLDAEIKELDTSGVNLEGTPFLEISPLAEEGGTLNLVPEHKASLSATYTLPIDESYGDVSFGVIWSYTDEQLVNTSAPAPYDYIDDRSLIDVNVHWRSVFNSAIDVSLFANNVTDEAYEVATGGGWGSFGIIDYLYGQPRMYGVRLRYNLGQ
ncbi:TonB-dependent receptor [Mangrovimicrobium sediminis]|uniref:TonB-dependent receptor n=1 Tax=Mangrovimicrobium sediminis TaxID=2562682 RepID=A0A4Z0M8U0_9GAMM|nr:TonB-dependent receptor [Haliea sp. SAOS-164]TGD76123.1 TonB-dependent receptor [Haliea sp. SAOS-164]